MKKIFLTSGLILCMACPAMAETTDITEGVTPTCTEPYLGTTENGANVAFEPIWDAYHFNVAYDYGEHGWDGSSALTGTVYSDTISASTNTGGVAGGATYGQAYAIPAAVTTSITNATHPGYTFVGWSTVANPTVDTTNNDAVSNAFNPSTYFVGTSLNDGATATVYAAYKPNTYAITFNCGTATAGTAMNSISVTYGAAIGTLPSSVTPTAENCTPAANTHFAGWSCTGLSDLEGATPTATTSTLYNHVGNTVCTAQWSADTINLKWYADTEGTETVQGPATCTVGGSLAVPETAPVAPAGYKFGGWTVVTETTAANHAEQQTEP